MEAFKGKDHFRIEVTENLGKDAQAALMLLYQPLIGHKAIAFYNTLNLLNPYKLYSFNDVLKLTGLSIYEFSDARTALERVQLLKTYLHEKSGNSLLVLSKPLLPVEFLKQKAMMNELKKILGVEMITELMQSYQTMNLLNDEYTDVSANPGYISVTAEKSESFGEITPQKEYDDVSISFDYDRFLRITSPLVFPYEARTTENLKLIGQMATLYGLSPEKMKIQVGHYCDEEKRTFNAESFRYSFYYLQLNEEVKGDDPYSMSPVAFLKSKMNGAQVTAIDRKLLEHLAIDLQFSSEVINVLVEYVLNNTNNNLSKAYVDKVASQWKRSNIHTKEEALKMCEKPKKGPVRKQVEVPEYYKRDDQGREWTQNDLSDEEKAMMAEMAKKLGG